MERLPGVHGGKNGQRVGPDFEDAIAALPLMAEELEEQGGQWEPGQRA